MQFLIIAKQKFLKRIILEGYSFRFDSGNFFTAVSSNFGHKQTTFGKVKGGIIVVSGYSSGAEVELFDNEQWIRQPDFTLERLHSYSTATIDNKLYIFGKQKILYLQIIYMIDSENILEII